MSVSRGREEEIEEEVGRGLGVSRNRRNQRDLSVVSS